MKKNDFLRNAMVAIALFVSTTAFAQNVPEFEYVKPVTNDGDDYTDGRLRMRFNSAAAWGDYNNDGNLDLIITGRTDGGGRLLTLYKNAGDGTFTKENTSIEPTQECSVSWLDYNNDGNLDIFITGRSGLDNGQDGKIAKLYQGDGAGAFTEVFANSFYGVNGNNDDNQRSRFVAIADYDNDGWVDIFYIGDNNGKQARLYKNNQGTGFSLVAAPVNGTDELMKFDGGSAVWGDANNDGYLDLLISGRPASGGTNGYLAVIYLNNGDGTFASPYVSPTSSEKSEIAFFDYNNDGLLDYLISGYGNRYQEDGTTYVADIYTNQGSMTFSRTGSDEVKIGGSESCSFDWGDVNNDGYIDLLFTRAHYNGNNGNAVYLNAGDGTFTKANFSPAQCWVKGVASLADYDNDGYLDALTMGENDGDTDTSIYTSYATTLFHNKGGENISANTAPSVPTGLDVTTDANGVVTFTWTASTDPEGSSLQYNLYVKKSDGSFTTFLLPANEITGKLKVNERLAGLVTTTYKINGLEDGGEYTLGVSAIDNGKMASAFATKAFTVGVGTDIGSSVAAQTPKAVQYFDLTGKPATATGKGVVIKKTIYEDGSVKNSKEIR